MNKSSKTAIKLAVLVCVMLGLSFAAVPFYDWFCRVTGFAGTPQVAVSAPDEILEQTIRIRFDASVAPDMPWEFKPEKRVMEVRIGESALAFYEAYNPTDRVVSGTASYNVTPDAAGGYFAKIECFCFTEQTLQPKERVSMPVSFFVDPEIVRDREGKFVKEITLSYTFYETEGVSDKQATLEIGRYDSIN